MRSSKKKIVFSSPGNCLAPSRRIAATERSLFHRHISHATMAKGPSKSKGKSKSQAGGGKEDDVKFTSPLTAAHLGQDTAKPKKKHRKKKKAPTTASDDEDGAHTLANRERLERKRVKDAKRARVERDRAEEAMLTEEIFGGGGDFEDGAFGGGDDVFSKIVSSKQSSGDDMDDAPAGLFQIDRTGAGADDDEEGAVEEMNEGRPAWEDSDEDGADNQDDESADEEDDDDEPKAAWVDEDDEDVAVSLMSSDRLRKLRKTLDETQELTGKDYQKRLRERYQKTAGAAVRTDWADVGALAVEEEGKERASDESDSDEDDYGPSASNILASTASLLSTSSKLPPNILKTIRCPDANLSDPNKSVVSSVQFHPGADPDAPLLLTAGLDKTLRFFRIDGDTNEKVHGIHFPNFPIYSASFLGDTGSVVVSSRRPHFYVYDAVAGKVDRIPNIPGREERSLETMATSPDGRLIAFAGNDGYIILVEAKSKLWVADLKMNGSARALTFTPDSECIIASGGDGEVYKWDIRSKRCVDRFKNEDGTVTSSLSASSRFLAVGAESGVVNMYNDRATSLSSGSFSTKRDPIKSIMNLHTSADYCKFNHDGQILAMSSRREKNSMKLLHVPTSTVFSNWPTSKTPLNYVWSMDFSPGSKYMTIGNDQGKCLLYRLLHYESD